MPLCTFLCIDLTSNRRSKLPCNLENRASPQNKINLICSVPTIFDRSLFRLTIILIDSDIKSSSNHTSSLSKLLKRDFLSRHHRRSIDYLACLYHNTEVVLHNLFNFPQYSALFSKSQHFFRRFFDFFAIFFKKRCFRRIFTLF